MLSDKQQTLLMAVVLGLSGLASIIIGIEAALLTIGVFVAIVSFAVAFALVVKGS